MTDISSGARSLLRSSLERYLRLYHRHEIQVDAEVPEPALIVSNHGFGGILDLNALAMYSVERAAGLRRPTTALVHQMAWTLRAGKIAEAMGGRPASPDAAKEAFAAGHNVLVFPGGDVDAGKAWRDRNRVRFHRRSGFARLAMEHGVPIVPVVTAGAGESLFVISDGRSIAKALQLPRLLRMKALPTSASIPWGVNVGMVGMLPYLPLPTKLITAVMAPMYPEPDESPADFAARVEAAMQARLDTLVRKRTPLLG